MIDANALISVIALSSAYLSRLIDNISVRHAIVSPTYVIDELKRVIKRKFPAKYD
jgi:regulator of extracellular matrix RemA (YlzA/DUF370 family)